MTCNLDFGHLLENKWGDENFRATPKEITELLFVAGETPDVPKWRWGQLAALLDDKAGLKPAKIAKAVKDARLRSELGRLPSDPKDMVRLWMAKHRLDIRFSGQYLRAGTEVSRDGVLNELKIWLHEIREPWPPYEAAVCLAESEAATRIARETFERLRHDGSTGELERLVGLLIGETGTDRFEATKAVLGGFLWRVKHHIGAMGQHPSASWAGHLHIMPVLHGPQGCGKSATIRKLLEPLGDMSGMMPLSFLEATAERYELARLPVVVFDELAGASKADVTKLKETMTAEFLQLRRLYGQASRMRVVSTFVGATNRCVSDQIRDETGNRRVFQIDCVAVPFEELTQLDFAKIWREIDECGVCPRVEPQNKRLIEAMQQGQRFEGPVAVWLAEGIDERFRDGGWHRVKDLWPDFVDWLASDYPSEHGRWNSTRFARELSRLASENRLSRREVHRTNEYRFHRKRRPDPIELSGFALDRLLRRSPFLARRARCRRDRRRMHGVMRAGSPVRSGIVGRARVGGAGRTRRRGGSFVRASSVERV